MVAVAAASAALGLPANAGGVKRGRPSVQTEYLMKWDVKLRRFLRQAVDKFVGNRWDDYE